MTLPPNFNHTENLQDGIKRLMNKEVTEWFRDVLDDSSDRAVLKRLCYHTENDSSADTQLRISLFNFIRGSTAERLLLSNSIPDRKYDMESLQHLPASNHPKIILFFAQKGESVPKGEIPVTAEVSFRLVTKINYTDSDVPGNVIDKNELKTLALKIKREFDGFKFVKGSQLFLCKNPIHGFFGSKVFATNKGDALDLFRKLHTLVAASFKEETVTLNTNLKRTSITRPTRKITGYDNKPKKEHRWRPVATVYFRYAIADCGLNTCIPLYDKSGIFHDALVR